VDAGRTAAGAAVLPPDAHPVPARTQPRLIAASIVVPPRRFTLGILPSGTRLVRPQGADYYVQLLAEIDASLLWRLLVRLPSQPGFSQLKAPV